MSTALEIVATGEVVEQMTAEEASSITTRISVKLDAIADNYEAVMPLIREAITRQAHVALGYRSAGEYAADRFGDALGRLGIDTRRAVVKELTEAGLSTRAIAPIVGASRETVRRDISGDTGVSPVPAPTVTCSDCGNVLSPGETCEGCYAPAYDADTDAWADDEPALTEEECRALADPDDLDEEPEPQPARITGRDGRSYPATRTRVAETAEQKRARQEREDREGQIDRTVSYLIAFVAGVPTVANFHTDPLRDEVLARFDPTTRERFLWLEKETTWPPKI